MKNVYYTDEVIGSVLAYMLNMTQLSNFLHDNKEGYEAELLEFRSITSDLQIDSESTTIKNKQLKELFEKIHAKQVLSVIMSKRTS